MRCLLRDIDRKYVRAFVNSLGDVNHGYRLLSVGISGSYIVLECSKTSVWGRYNWGEELDETEIEFTVKINSLRNYGNDLLFNLCSKYIDHLSNNLLESGAYISDSWLGNVCYGFVDGKLQPIYKEVGESLLTEDQMNKLRLLKKLKECTVD